MLSSLQSPELNPVEHRCKTLDWCITAVKENIFGIILFHPASRVLQSFSVTRLYILIFISSLSIYSFHTVLLACTFCITTLKREVKPLEVAKKNQYFRWMLSCSLNKIESTPVCRSTEPQDILPEQKRWGVKELKLTTISSNLTSLGKWPWHKVNTLWGALTCESNTHGGGKEPRFLQHVYFLHQTTSDTRRLLYIYRKNTIYPSIHRHNALRSTL